MEEVYADTFDLQTRWQPRPNDPELEAVLLTRLMIKLGTPAEAARQAQAAPAPAPRARAVPGQPHVLLVDDGFDRAWRRVGIALDRTGFTVEDRDRSQGTFYVRYADPALAGKEQPGFFARLFSNAKTFEATARYRVALKSDAASTSINVLTEQGGVPEATAVAPIVQLLIDELK
jgi:outer membrane protein assembly factor BamC